MQPTVALPADGFKHVVDGRLETLFSGSVIDRIEVDDHVVRVIGNTRTARGREKRTSDWGSQFGAQVAHRS